MGEESFIQVQAATMLQSTRIDVKFATRVLILGRMFTMKEERKVVSVVEEEMGEETNRVMGNRPLDTNISWADAKLMMLATLRKAIEDLEKTE